MTGSLGVRGELGVETFKHIFAIIIEIFPLGDALGARLQFYESFRFY